MAISTIIFWVLVTAFILPSLYFGYIKLVGTPAKITQFKAWGFPEWFMRCLGFVEIAGAIALIFPQTRLLGIIGWAVILTGAIFVNLKNKEPKAEVMTACIVSVQLLLIYGLGYLW